MDDADIEVAFGLARNLHGFKRVAPQAVNYLDLGLNPYSENFADQLLVIMNDARHIYFDLSGMRMLNTPDGVLYGPVELNPIGSTNWELRTIWDNPALRVKTTFYRDERILSVRDVERLF